MFSPGGAAWDCHRIGIGDIIYHVDNQPVRTADDIFELVVGYVLTTHARCVCVCVQCVEERDGDRQAERQRERLCMCMRVCLHTCVCAYVRRKAVH